MQARPDGATAVAFATLVLLAGSNAVAISFSNRELPPFWGAALRFTLASAVFLALVAARRLALPRGRALAGVLLYGAVNFGLAYGLVYWGIQFVAPGLAQVLLALAPLFTLLLAVAHGAEPFRPGALLGAFLALGGVAVVFREHLGAEAPLLGLVAVVGTAACIAEAAVVVKRFPPVDPVVANGVGMAAGALILLALSLASGEPQRLPRQGATLAALAFLVLVGSVAVFALYLFVLHRWTASAASYQFVLLPFVTLAVSAWLTDERLTPGYAIGGALVLAGVYAGALRRPTPAPARAAHGRVAGPPKQ